MGKVKMTTIGQVYKIMLEAGVPQEVIEQHFAQKGWDLPRRVLNNKTRALRPTTEQILSGKVRLVNNNKLVSDLFTTLINQYNVPAEWLSEYLRPLKEKHKPQFEFDSNSAYKTQSAPVQASEPEDEPATEYEPEDEEVETSVYNIF